ncbi:MAG: ATP-binding cassette domain-containing protein, partial [archaeon]|nr:ATP-binding cassette domain-containing protein [archaeon]
MSAPLVLSELTCRAADGDAEANRQYILEKVSFSVRRDQMTVILGPAGSGRSTLLRAIGGQRPPGIEFTGKIAFEGQNLPNSWPSSVAFVRQNDRLVPSMTVEETIRFAAACSLEFHDETTKEQFIDLTINMLRLDHVRRSIVGDQTNRGISGGERRRVSIAVALARSPRIILLDEVTNGLSSSQALLLMEIIRGIFIQTNLPVVATLVQPSDVMLKLFDQLVLLNQLGQVYFVGTIPEAVSHLSALGVPKLPEETLYEYFSSASQIHANRIAYRNGLGDPASGAQVQIGHQDDDDDGDHDQHQVQQPFPSGSLISLESPTLPQQLAEAWAKTTMQQSIETTAQSIQGELPTMPERNPKYILSRFTQFWMLMKRQIPLNLYNWQFMIRTSRVVFLSFAFLFIYWDIASLDTGSPVALASALSLFLAVFLVWGGSSMSLNEPVVGVVLPVERMDSYYSMLPYSISVVFAEAPFFLLDTILVTIIFYLGLGLNLEGERIVYFGLLLFLMGSLISTLMNCSRAFVGQEGLATAVGMQVAILSAAYGTFYRTRAHMPVWLRWATYISPLTWFYQGLMSNQYQGTVFNGCDASFLLPAADDPLLDVPVDLGGFGGFRTCAFGTGNEVLGFLDIPTNYSWKWVCMAVIFGYVLLFFVLLCLCMKRFIVPFSRMREAPKVSASTTSIQQQHTPSSLPTADFTFCCNGLSYSLPAHMDWRHACSNERR